MDAGDDVVATTHDDDVLPEALAHPAEPVVRERRKPIALWDRVKLLLLFATMFGLFVWNDVSSNPILPLEDAVDRQVEARWWLFVLAGLELVRQVHYVLSEGVVSPSWVVTTSSPASTSRSPPRSRPRASSSTPRCTRP